MITRQWIAERPYILAAAISLALVVWMASGLMASKPTEATDTAQQHKLPIPKVKVETMTATAVYDSVDLYGRTEPNRSTTLKAEVAGRITEVLAKRGTFVKKGDVVAKIAENDLPAQLEKSKALLVQREMEYQGALKLNKDGYQGRVQLSRAEADLAAVKAEIKRLEVALDHTVIRAAFDGVMNTRYVEVGDYVKVGDQVAMLADLTPLVVRAHATEHQVTQLKKGQAAEVKLLNGLQFEGHIRYIASVADDATNTFKIEVAIENAEHKLLAGISSEVLIALDQVPAIKISPALLALDEQGNVGVKTVVDDQVKFTDINIVKSESDGIWLTGLGEQANIITLGQGFVRAGDKVQAVYSDTDTQ